MTIQYKAEPTEYKTVAFVFRLTSEGEMMPTEGTKKLKEECKYYEPILQSQSITPDGYHLIVVMTFIMQGGIKEIQSDATIR